MTKLVSHRFMRTLIITFTLLGSSQSMAASVCKGQPDAACGQNDSCYWVTGYQRSDGANVKSHCRTKPQASLKDSAKETSEVTDTKKMATKVDKKLSETQ
ncbi:hypothetical protein [Neptunomonas antarctica]|uniref:Uncharacterized protein n=1 Tax=Neptunomonas antarctica TaxID=619304 RepID=A0A1N7N9F2_9GAMM|nr:hypothetical protein [Neptunomonas antarctica]SIS94985.1 hypothetical protein SAMN05421760_108160 [Neptunomonas antarctica]